MSELFELSSKLDGKCLQVSLSGKLDEDAVLEPLDTSSVEKIVIDTENLKMINSIGVRTWTKFAAAIPLSIPVVVENCPHIFVSSARIIEGFVPKNFTVRSARIPYFCPACENVTEILQTREAGPIKEHLECSSCGKMAELDVLLEEYETLFPAKAS